ncbi:envoplakin a isoform X2 [Periophthalmus magnuspinnatus]|uniref:envoplakin a isoform X2 n=1 Tax=Periophthalmus magnuspinnatus TaxID=409849 RepID=UPI002436AC01|nr:envoplakin a isoform X2 [Periophthalmus magnuspinnatus]
MLKKNKESTLKMSGKISKTQAGALALLIQQMQKNADQVEKDILRAEDLLAVDDKNDKQELPLQHQEEISDRLGEAEGLLKDLFLDVDKAKKLHHPQAKDIESDVILLHERWLKDCTFYRDIYEQIDDVSLMPRIDWGPVFAQKQKQLADSDQYGPTMADLERQIAAHNILHKEVEAYSSQLCVSSAGSKESYTAFKKQYNNILDNSKWRRHYLTSLYEYMQGCNKELTFLQEEQDKIKKQDWSERMVDPPDVRRQYENFKNNSLLSHETEVNKLQDEGDRLVELKHPASATITAQRDAVRNEWQQFLNLCICQETHLDNVEEYKKYHMDCDQLSETLTKLNSSLDPKAISKRSNYETLMQLEGEEKDVQNSEQLLADLRRRSTSIAPLKLRRGTSSRPVTVESLCDWDSENGSLNRGEKFTLKSINDEKWSIMSPGGATQTVPGVCFQIPPPDPEAIDKVDLLGAELADIQKKRAAVEASLKNHKKEVDRVQQSAAPVASATVDPKARALADQLSKLDSDLAKAEADLLNRLRTPLDRSDPTGDLAKKLRDQEEAAKALKALEQQRRAAQADLQPLLSSGASASLPQQLSSFNNKQDNLAGLSDLYAKKANASLNLERQIQKVDGIVSNLENNLSADGPISDDPNAVQRRAEDIRNQKRAVAAADGDMKKLSKDLELTEQLCSSLQQSYQEYCPDIQRQRTEVKKLQTRYTNVGNQLNERQNILQEVGTKNQEFQSTSKSLNSFLDNMPTNQISPYDDLSQISMKQNSQERVMDDLKRKRDDLDRLSDLSMDLQNLLNDYETNVDKYNGTLEDSGISVAKQPYVPTLSSAIEKEEKSLINRYSEATAENTQRQKQMGLAKNLVVQNEEKVQMVAQQQVQLENQQKSVFELSNLKKELDEERERNQHAETNLKTFKERMLSLQSRRGVERVEEKEVLQYYRDPKLETDLMDLQKILHEETLKRTTTQSDIELTNSRITIVEDNIKNAPRKLVTKEVTEFERDPQLDIEAAKMRNEISKMRDEIRVRDGEHVQARTEITILQQKRPPIKERVVKKEVVKVEQDPEMIKSVKTFQTELSDESNRITMLNDQIFQTRSMINSLERLIPNIQPKIIKKEVKKVEQDPELITESEKIRVNLENERGENSALSREVTELQSRYREVQLFKPRIEVKEIVNEIYHIDPSTEMEITRLRKDIQESSRQRSDLDREITQLTSELNHLRSQKPKIEHKEVLQEVIKEERSPENEREIQRLNSQVNSLYNTYSSLQDQVLRLRSERDELKIEKSKIETQLVTKEVVKYQNDPLLEKEADRLRKNVREEAQMRRNIEEMVYDLKNKYILLERQKPEEKVVVQEVVRLQKDPRQMHEHDRLSRNLDEEIQTRRQIDLEIQQLRTRLADKERMLRDSDERQKRIQAESELRDIRLRITQLENAPPPVEESIVVEEVLKVERDPKLERMTNGLRADMDKETSNILRIQREIRNLTVKLEILQREKSGEKTVYKEVVRVEKDQVVESERERLREQVTQQRFAREDVEDELRRLNDKINLLMSSKSSTSREETTLTLNKDALQRERDDLIRELRTLETKSQDVSFSFQQQSKLMSERTQMSRQKSLKMESDVQRLERDILNEKDKIHSKDSIIRELTVSIQKEDHSETRTKETNVSTKITILDPETGRDMSPYDAYLQGLIDRQQYTHLQQLECDWEEVTSMGPDGETTMLQDCKSGKQYSIKEALRVGRLTDYDLQKYKQGKLPISEFALLVAGDNKQSAVTFQTSSTVKSAPPSGKGPSPIAGVMDTTTGTCYTVRSATAHKMIDLITAQRLLEAQAATGGIIDITTQDRCTVHKALSRGLIDDSQTQRLLNAQKAFSGVEDPLTKEVLSIGEAIQKGWMPKDTAIRYMEVQHLTGGLVNPRNSSRVSIMDAIGAKMIDSTLLRELQSESAYTKDITDPLTKEKINYKQALERCKRDPQSGLVMLPASSKEQSYSSTYTSKYARF